MENVKSLRVEILPKEGYIDLIVKEDMICPKTKLHCDDECCTVGSTCNLVSELEGFFPPD